MRVPVLVADDHCNYLQMPLNEFIAKFIREGSGVAYVKDWHFQAYADERGMINRELSAIATRLRYTSHPRS